MIEQATEEEEEKEEEQEKAAGDEKEEEQKQEEQEEEQQEEEANKEEASGDDESKSGWRGKEESKSWGNRAVDNWDAIKYGNELDKIEDEKPEKENSGK